MSFQVIRRSKLARKTRLPDTRLETRSAIPHWDEFEKISHLERRDLHSTFETSTTYHANKIIIAEGDTVRGPRLVLSGWAMSFLRHRGGTRRVIDFHLPGEFFGFGSRPSTRALLSYVALTEVCVSSEFVRLVGGEKEHSKLWTAAADAEERQLRRHILKTASLEQPQARTRLATFLLDLYMRLSAVGLTDNGSYVTPVTQEMMANALGLNTATFKYFLRTLRSEGIIDLRYRLVRILKYDELVRIAAEP